MKLCKRCGLEKIDADFYFNRSRNTLAYCCKQCTKLGVLKWNAENPEKAKARELRYRESHRKEIAARTAKWYSLNKKRNNENTLNWYKEHKHRGAEKRAKYRATQAMATPTWANSFFIREAYHLAQLRTKIFGFKWSVDHIIPLKSKIVCGLHVENNLQVIPAIKNSVKGNRTWPDMPV